VWVMPIYRTVKTIRSIDGSHHVRVETAPGRHPDRATCSCDWGAHATPVALQRAIEHHLTNPDEWKRYNRKR
jgi:hypothetical protein